MSSRGSKRVLTYGTKKSKLLNETWDQVLGEDNTKGKGLHMKARGSIWSSITTSPFKEIRQPSSIYTSDKDPFSFTDDDQSMSDPFSFDLYDSQGSSQSTGSPVKSPGKFNSGKRGKKVQKSFLQGKKYTPGQVTFSANDIKVENNKRHKSTKKTETKKNIPLQKERDKQRPPISKRTKYCKKTLIEANKSDQTNEVISSKENNITENSTTNSTSELENMKDCFKTKSVPLFSYYENTSNNNDKKNTIYLGSKRPIFPDSDEDLSNKEKEIDSFTNSTEQENSQQDSQNSIPSSSQDSGSSISSSQKLRSPFKTLKPKYYLNHDSKKIRRFSALPTSLDSTDFIDEDEHKDVEEKGDEKDDYVPRALYSTFLFPSKPNPVEVKRSEKELYKVVRNVKKASECIEYGETQQYEDDLEYLLDGVKDNHSSSTRCLSALELAKKCLKPNFRLHVKAHGIIESVFTALQDAINVESLAFCTSAVYFVLANDKMMIDFDDKIIEFILKLVSRKQGETKSKEYEKMRAKARKILEDCESICLEDLSATNLALETLLSITSRQTGVWFKEKIRTQGGIDHIIDSVYDSSRYLNNHPASSKTLSRIRRCIELLCDVTISNVENQNHLLQYRDCLCVSTLIELLKSTTTHLCDSKNDDVSLSEEREIGIVSILKLLVTVTHRNSVGIMKICKQDGALEFMLYAVFIPQKVQMKRSFEVVTMSLASLINIVEQNPSCISTLLSSDIKLPTHTATKRRGRKPAKKSCLDMLVSLFLLKYHSGREGNLMKELDRIEKEGENESDGVHFHEDEEGFTCGDRFDETNVSDETKVKKNSSVQVTGKNDVVLNEEEKKDIKYVLSKAHDNMMDSHVAGYTAILLGLIAEHDEDHKNAIMNLLPDNTFKPLTETLERILAFVKTAKTVDDDGCQTMTRVILFFKNTEEEKT